MIYFDNASTTKASQQSCQVLSEYSSEKYFNPSALYKSGVEAKKLINECRLNILRHLKGDGNLIFTSGGTESDNMAIFGTKKPNNSRVIFGNAEHAAVFYPSNMLKQRGYDVVYAAVDGFGKVDFDAFKSLMTADTSFVSIMHVNNETGAVNDIKSLVKYAKEVNPDVIFHSDGVQALGKVEVNLKQLGVDIYSLSAHKIYAPKGVGAIYFNKNVNISPLIIGGGQENGFRSSTENTAGIAAFSQAVTEVTTKLKPRTKHVKEIKDYVFNALIGLDGMECLSDKDGSAYILTLCSKKVRGEVMQHALEKEDIIIGTGSACASNKSTRRIPEALGLIGNKQYGIMRISFGDFNTMEEAEIFTSKFCKLYGELKKYGK